MRINSARPVGGLLLAVTLLAVTLMAGTTAPAIAASSADTRPGVYAYLPDNSAQQVIMIDTANNTTAYAIPLDSRPEVVAASPDGASLYVSSNTGLYLVDVASRMPTAFVPGARGLDIAVSPDDTRVYLALGSQITVVDTATASVTGTIRLNGVAQHVALSADGLRAFVTGADGIRGFGGLWVLDTQAGTVVREVPLGAMPAPMRSGGSGGGQVAVSQDGRVGYASFANYPGHIYSLSAVDTTTGAPVSGRDTAAAAAGLTLSADGSQLYASIDRAVVVYDTVTGAVANTFAVSGQAGYIQLSPDESRAYAALPADNTLAVVDTRTGAVSTIPVPAYLRNLAVAEFAG